MAKRFTDNQKWEVRWFRRLRPEFKLAWLYLLDNCDVAGVIRVDEELADFQIGVQVDWPSFFESCEGRIARLADGKMWVTDFIEFQYGSLSLDCSAHRPILKSIEKHGLKPIGIERVSKGLAKGFRTFMDKEKEKEKEMDQVLEGGVGETIGWEIPPPLDTPEVRRELESFAAMRRRIKKPIRDLKNTSRVLKRFTSPDDLLFVLDYCITNEYQGIDPGYLKKRPPLPVSRVYNPATDGEYNPVTGCEKYPVEATK